MKKRKVMTFLMATLLFVVSFNLTVYADVDTYSFGGSCTRFFTTSKYLEQKDKDWPQAVDVFCTELSFNANPTYDYGCVVLVKADGKTDSVVKDVKLNKSVVLIMPEEYSSTTIQVRLIHPYYDVYATTASSSIHIAGVVEKTDVC